METVDDIYEHDDHEHDCVRSESVLAQILTNLSLKQLISFKSVSKRWNSLISSPFFSKHYIVENHQKLLDSSSSPPWTLLRRRPRDATPLKEDHSTTISTILFTEISSRDDQLLNVAVCDYPPPEPVIERYEVVSSSNGLLLCRVFWQCTVPAPHNWSAYGLFSPLMHSPYYYAICNSVTRQWTVLPPRKTSFGENVNECFVTKPDPSGGLKVIAYKVFLLHYDPSYRDRRGVERWHYKEVFDMDIYDSETKTWTKSTLRFPFTCRIDGDARPACLNGILHWKVWLFRAAVPNIAAYDPHKLPGQKLRVIGCPAIRIHSGRIHTLIEAIRGNLHYLAIDENLQVLVLWVREDYHHANGWVLKHRYDINYSTRMMLRSPADYYKPLAFHPFDANIIYLLTDEKPNKVMAYDLIRETVIPLSVKPPICHPNEVFPFVLPLWPPTIDC